LTREIASEVERRGKTKAGKAMRMEVKGGKQKEEAVFIGFMTIHLTSSCNSTSPCITSGHASLFASQQISRQGRQTFGSNGRSLLRTIIWTTNKKQLMIQPLMNRKDGGDG